MTGIWERIRGRSSPDLSCRELVELVTLYLEGGLTDEEGGRFERHLSACPGCANYLDQMRETIALVGRIEADDLAAETKSELLAAFRGWPRS